MTMASFAAFESVPSGRAFPSVLFGASVLGGLTGVFISDIFQPTPGQVAVATNFTALGTLAGVFLHAAVDNSASELMTTVLISSTLSLIGGAGVSQRLDWSVARAGVVFAGGGAGAAVGALLVGALASKPSVGGLIGLAAGTAVTIGATSGYTVSRHAPAITLAPSAAIGSDGGAYPPSNSAEVSHEQSPSTSILRVGDGVAVSNFGVAVDLAARRLR